MTIWAMDVYVHIEMLSHCVVTAGPTGITGPTGIKDCAK